MEMPIGSVEILSDNQRPSAHRATDYNALTTAVSYPVGKFTLDW